MEEGLSPAEFTEDLFVVLNETAHTSASLDLMVRGQRDKEQSASSGTLKDFKRMFYEAGYQPREHRWYLSKIISSGRGQSQPGRGTLDQDSENTHHFFRDRDTGEVPLTFKFH